MANYFVINSKFKPYSFDELIKPYQIYGQAYKEQEALIDAAREKEFSPDYLDQTQDAAAYNMYNTATQNLQAASDELATKGLSSSLRGRLRTVAKDYQRTMGALNTAQAQLAAERDRRAKLGEDYVYQQDNLRIGDFLNGATPNQSNTSLSGITKEVAAEFATKAKAISKSTWDKVLGPNGNTIGGYYDVTTKAGLEEAQLGAVLALSNPETWNKYVASNPTISDAQKKELQSFVDVIKTKMDAVGFDKYSDANQRKIWDAIVTGAQAGLYTESHDYKQDRNFESPELRYRKERDEAEDKRLQEDRDKASGKIPYFVDQNGNKYFMNTTTQTMWSTDKNGNMIDKPTYKTQVGKDNSSDAEATSGLQTLTSNQDLPIYMQDTRPGWFTENDNTPAHKGGRADFNERNNKPIDLKDFGEARTEKLKTILAEYNKNYKTNLTLGDVQIYKDTDVFTNEFKIVLKNQVIAEMSGDTGEVITTPTSSKADTITAGRSNIKAGSLGFGG